MPPEAVYTESSYQMKVNPPRPAMSLHCLQPLREAQTEVLRVAVLHGAPRGIHFIVEIDEPNSAVNASKGSVADAIDTEGDEIDNDVDMLDDAKTLDKVLQVIDTAEVAPL